jgi:5,10-methylenetetrahydromethanopterin reductase
MPWPSICGPEPARRRGREGVYPDLVHAEDWDLAVRLCDPYVSDEAAYRFAREFCLFGTPAEITARLAVICDAGATGVFLQHGGSYAPPDEVIEAVGAQILTGSVPC